MRLLSSGELVGAERIADSVLHAVPGQPDALHLKGLAARRRGLLEEAEAHLRASLQIRPGHPIVLGNLGNVLLAAARHSEAISVYKEALDLAPDHADAAANLAIALLESGDATGAIDASRELARKHPGKAGVWATLGRALRQSGNAIEAIEPLERSLALRPQHPPTQLALAVALRDAGRPLQAIDFLNALLGTYPDLAEAAYLLGHCHYDLGQTDSAIAAYRRAVLASPRDRAMLDTLSRILWQTGATDAYLLPYAESLEAWPDDGGLLADLVFKLGLANRPQDALRLAQDARARGIHHPELLHREAQCCLALGDIAAADTALRTALELAPANDDLRLELVRVKLAAADAPAADLELGHILATSPYDQQALAYQGLAWRQMEDRRFSWLNDVGRFVKARVLQPPDGDIAGFNDRLAKCLTGFHAEMALHPLDQTLRGGTQTMGMLLDRPEPEIRTLAGMLRDAVARYVAELDEEADHPFLKRRSRSFSFSGSWSVRLSRSGYHLNHVHREGWISSCYYVALPEAVAEGTSRQGWISFGQSGIGPAGSDTELKAVQPEVGMLVLFPSYLYHGTIPFESDSARLTVAFDILPD